METMVQARGSMNDSFHLSSFPNMAWVGPSALPTMVMMLRLEADFPRVSTRPCQEISAKRGCYILTISCIFTKDELIVYKK